MNFHRKLYFTIAVSAGLYLAWVIWAGWQGIVDAFTKFAWPVLPLCLLLAFGNYLIRFCKWHYYLQRLGIDLPKSTSFQVFLSGMVMSATPGKLGEVFKSYLVKEINGAPKRITAPIILAERLTDFIAFLVLAMLGITLLPNGAFVFALSIGLVVLFLILVSWKAAAEKIISICHGLPKIGPHTDKIEALYKSTYRLIAPGPLFIATIISVFSWFLECISFALILWGFDYPLPIATATFMYAFATILGALLMTPGGLGVTEGSLSGLLILLANIPKDIATSATLLIRLCTLWFGVAVGMAALALFSKNFIAQLPDEMDSDDQETLEPITAENEQAS